MLHILTTETIMAWKESSAFIGTKISHIHFNSKSYKILQIVLYSINCEFKPLNDKAQTEQ